MAPMRAAIALLGVLTGLAGSAAADVIIVERPPPPPPPPEDHVGDWKVSPASFEWTTWFRIGGGVSRGQSNAAARATGAVTDPVREEFVAAFGLGATLGATDQLRVGGWAELQGTKPAAGIEVLVHRLPRTIDMFMYDGEGTLSLRAGGNSTHATFAVAYGYRCPWKLWGPYYRSTRYTIGARVIGVVQRAYRDSRDWSATLGIEVEPVGAIRYLLGIRSWY